MEGSSFEVQGSGPDARAIGSLAGLHLPSGSYTISGRVDREGNRLRLQDIEAEVGRSRLAVTGIVGDPPGYEGTDLSIEASGPDLSAFQGFSRIDLPGLPFEVSGELKPGDGAIALEGVTGRLGDSSIRLAGRLMTSGGMVRLEAHRFCRRTRWLGGGVVIRHRRTASSALSGTGRCRSAARWFSCRSGSRHLLGDSPLSADGFIIQSVVWRALKRSFDIAGPDISFPVSLVSPFALPSLPFTVGGAMRVGESGYELTEVSATVGDIELPSMGCSGRGRASTELTRLFGSRVRSSRPSARFCSSRDGRQRRSRWPRGCGSPMAPWLFDEAIVDFEVCSYRSKRSNRPGSRSRRHRA